MFPFLLLEMTEREDSTMEIIESAAMILFVFLVLPKLLPAVAKVLNRIIRDDKF